jgi:hypothetical protein
MRAFVTKRAMREWIHRLASIHFERCPHGYMNCKCEFAAVLREMMAVAEDQRGGPENSRKKTTVVA